MKYTILVYQDTMAGFWFACKKYEDGTRGPFYMFSLTADSVIYKLEQDGESRDSISVVQN